MTWKTKANSALAGVHLHRSPSVAVAPGAAGDGENAVLGVVERTFDHDAAAGQEGRPVALIRDARDHSDAVALVRPDLVVVLSVEHVVRERQQVSRAVARGSGVRRRVRGGVLDDRDGLTPLWSGLPWGLAQAVTAIASRRRCRLRATRRACASWCSSSCGVSDCLTDRTPPVKRPGAGAPRRGRAGQPQAGGRRFDPGWLHVRGSGRGAGESVPLRRASAQIRVYGALSVRMADVPASRSRRRDRLEPHVVRLAASEPRCSAPAVAIVLLLADSPRSRSWSRAVLGLRPRRGRDSAGRDLGRGARPRRADRARRAGWDGPAGRAARHRGVPAVHGRRRSADDPRAPAGGDR